VVSGQEFDTWVALIGSGKRVRVVMDRDDPHAFSEGELVGLTDDGQGTVIEDDGLRHYVWPVLEVSVLEAD
jgi:hypothetical protein